MELFTTSSIKSLCFMGKGRHDSSMPYTEWRLHQELLAFISMQVREWGGRMTLKNDPLPSRPVVTD